MAFYRYVTEDNSLAVPAAVVSEKWYWYRHIQARALAVCHLASSYSDADLRSGNTRIEREIAHTMVDAEYLVFAALGSILLSNEKKMRSILWSMRPDAMILAREQGGGCVGI